MTIEKNGKTYNVRENKTSWTLSAKIENVKLTVNVSKTDCATFDSLKAFIAENDLL